MIAIAPANVPEPSGQSRPVDQAGIVQLVLTSNGATRHKAIRTFNNGVWTQEVDNAANQLTYVNSSNSFTFYWTGLTAGDRVGVITATTHGCMSRGLDSSLTPQVPIS